MMGWNCSDDLVFEAVFRKFEHCDVVQNLFQLIDECRFIPN